MNRTITRHVLQISGGIAALAALAAVAGARINTTRSYPLGLYWITGETARRGSLVIACPPPVEAVAEGLRRGYIGAGFCPGGYGYVIKKIVATPGDRVAVTELGVTVNGQVVPNSAARQADPAGRPLPSGPAAYTIGTTQVLLMSDFSPRSFDGRYFGPVESSNLRGVLKPVFTF